MKKVHNSIEVWRHVDGSAYSRLLSLAPCPHCLGYELAVFDVQVDGRSPDQWPDAVHCGGCGARGPWGQSEEDAVALWNSTSGVETEFRSEWALVHTPGLSVENDPF